MSLSYSEWSSAQHRNVVDCRHPYLRQTNSSSSSGNEELRRGAAVAADEERMASHLLRCQPWRVNSVLFAAKRDRKYQSAGAQRWISAGATPPRRHHSRTPGHGVGTVARVYTRALTSQVENNEYVAYFLTISFSSNSQCKTVLFLNLYLVPGYPAGAAFYYYNQFIFYCCRSAQPSSPPMHLASGGGGTHH